MFKTKISGDFVELNLYKGVDELFYVVYKSLENPNFLLVSKYVKLDGKSILTEGNDLSDKLASKLETKIFSDSIRTKNICGENYKPVEFTQEQIDFFNKQIRDCLVEWKVKTSAINKSFIGANDIFFGENTFYIYDKESDKLIRGIIDYEHTFDGKSMWVSFKELEGMSALEIKFWNEVKKRALTPK